MVEPSCKVLFRVPDEEGGATVETLWAIPLGGDLYQLDNSPFYAYGVSWKDTVHAPFTDEEQMPTFLAVASKSGHRTVRVKFDPPVEPGNASDRILQGLVRLGCSFEGANPRYMAIDIPPGVQLESVSTYLVASDAIWEHADPTYEELHPDDP
jgi:hypothetical protein